MSPPSVGSVVMAVLRGLKESCPQPIPSRSLRRSGGGKRGVCEDHNRIVSMLGPAMRNRLTEEHVHDASPLMLVCGFLACFALSKALLKHVVGHQCPFLPQSSRSRIAWSVGVEPCSHLRERGQGAGLLFQQ